MTKKIILAMVGIITFVLMFGNTPMVSAQTFTTICGNSTTTTTINGYVGLNGNSSVSVWFEWGPSQSLGNSTTQQTFYSDSNFSQQIYGLTENTTYYYRAMGRDDEGIETGEIKSFRTTCTTQAPTVNINANPNSINYNSSSIITWNSNNATYCSANGGTNGWAGNKSLNGTWNTGALTNNITYAITCTNSNGQQSYASVGVSVGAQPAQTCQDSSAINRGGTLPCRYNTIVNNPQPTVALSADNTSIAYNGTTVIRWYSTNVNSCTATGGSVGWAGPKNTGPGSFFTGSLNAPRTYAITCVNNYGSVEDYVTVNVRPQIIISTTQNTPRTPATSLVFITSTVDKTQPIIPNIDNSRPEPGDEINYTVAYQNIGTGAITNTRLQLSIPSEVDYLSSSPNNPSILGNTLIFNLGTLKANGEGKVSVRVRVRENIPSGTLLNFPAVLSYVDPSGLPQSASVNVSAEVFKNSTTPTTTELNNKIQLEGNVFSAGFLPTNIFGWLFLIILILVLFLLARYAFVPTAKEVYREIHNTPPQPPQ